MSWMAWNERLQTGHAQFDEAHKKLVDIVNQLAYAMEKNEPKESCDALLDQFIGEIQAHFTAEEQLMAARRYPKAAEHNALHRALLKDVVAFRNAYNAGNVAQSATLLSILDTWLTRDMMGADKELTAFMAASA
jgi:hemerythrin